MREEHFFELLNDIDDSLIMEAAEMEKEVRCDTKKKKRWRTLPYAACLLIVLGMGSTFVVNAATGGAVFQHVKLFINGDEYTGQIQDTGDSYLYQDDNNMVEIAKDDSWGSFGGDGNATMTIVEDEDSGEMTITIEQTDGTEKIPSNNNETYLEEKSGMDAVSYLSILQSGDGQTFQKLKTPESTAHMQEFLDWINFEFTCTECSCQNGGIAIAQKEYFDKELEFVEHEDEDVVNQEMDEEYYTPLKSFQINAALNEELDGLMGGRSFYPEDFIYDPEHPIPMLMGSHYKKYYEIGNIMDLAYCNDTFTYEVVGFFPEDFTFYSDNVETNLNTVLVTPFFEIHTDEADVMDGFILYSYLDTRIGDTRIMVDGLSQQEIRSIQKKVSKKLKELDLNDNYEILDVTTSRFGFFEAGK